MIIKNTDWLKYIQTLRKISDKAAETMENFLDAHQDDFGAWDDPDIHDMVLDYAYGISEKYGAAAAEVACQMYDSIARQSDVDVPEAEPEELPVFAEVAAGVNGAMSQSKRPDVTASAVSRQVKKAAVRTTKKNAVRDNAEWAWIPQGNETCAFCIMLASTGWHPARSSEHAEHLHQNCDCMYAVRFNSDTSYEGYETEVYEEAVSDAGGDLNELARNFYSKHKDEINVRKREAYAIRKELNK